jgi:multidrug efflux system outer membrane protein
MGRYCTHRPVLAMVISPIVPMLLLSGCIAPRYLRPDVPIPPMYRGDTAAPGVPGANASLGDLRWQDLIHDEELSKLIQEALSKNFDAQIAAARVLEARAQLTVARSARFPSINAQTGYNNLRTAQSGSIPLPPGYQAESDY